MKTATAEGPERGTVRAHLLRPALAAGAVALLIVGGSVAASRLTRPERPSVTAAQTALAESVARSEAVSSVPGPTGQPLSVASAQADVAPGDWPANVDTVSFVPTTRRSAMAFVDDSGTNDDREVLVVRLTGRFSLATTGPPGSSHVATGTEFTVVVDAVTGEVLDTGLEAPPAAASLPGSVSLFARG